MMKTERYRANGSRMALVWIGMWLSIACSPVNTTVSSMKPETDPSQANSDDASSKFMSRNPEVESTLTLPSWCKMVQTDAKVCFRCARIDGNVTLDYEQCLTPGRTFKASKDCWFTEELTKKIKCQGTVSGERFVMDVSTAREKVTESVPAILLAINIAVASKYDANSDAVRLTRDISSFFGSHIQQIMRREDIPGAARDLTMLAKKHIPSGLTEVQAEVFTALANLTFEQMVTELTGKKDYDLAGVILRGVQLSRTLLTGDLESSKNNFTGANVAGLLSGNDNLALEEFFKVLSPGVAGVGSTDRFLARLREDD